MTSSTLPTAGPLSERRFESLCLIWAKRPEKRRATAKTRVAVSEEDGEGKDDDEEEDED